VKVSHQIVKPLVFAVSAGPLVFLLWDAFTREPDIIYFNGIVRSTGYWSLRFLCLTLAITPVRWWTGWHFLIKFRRQFGLFSFFYAAVHTAAYIALDRVAALDVTARADLLMATERTMSAIVVDLQRPFFWIGLAALLLMTPLAATSTAGMIRRLKGRRWQALHRLVYPAAIASVLHTYWPLNPGVHRYIVVFGIVFAFRLARAYAHRRLPQQPAIRASAI
jgi:sulfoxide reductase heme-binding subunit YedZ